MAKAVLDFDAVCDCLEQKPPFVLIDRVTELIPGKKIATVKNITGSELFSGAHFPGMALYPGIFIVEAAAQTVSVLWHVSENSEKQKNRGIMVLGGIQRFSFCEALRPGDTMQIVAELIRSTEDAAIARASAAVGDETVASGQLTFGRIQR